MKTSEILSSLTKLRNEIIFKICANTIICIIVNIVLANKFIEYFNDIAAPFLFGGVVISFIWIIYFTAASIDNYNFEYEKLIRKLS